MTLLLIHGMLQVLDSSHAGAGLAILDHRVLRLLRALGVPIRPLPGQKPAKYFGSPSSTPCYVDVPETIATLSRLTSHAATAVLTGSTLPQSALPDAESYRLAAAA